MVQTSSIFYSISKDLSTILANKEKFIGDFMEILSKHLQVSRVSLWELDENHENILCLDLYEKELGKHSKGTVLSKNDFPSYFKGLIDSENIIAENAHTHPFTKEFSEPYLSPLGINSLLDVPFYVSSKLNGVICFEHQGDFRKWTEQEINFTQLICAGISMLYSAIIAVDNQKIISENNTRLLAQNVELYAQQEEILTQRDYIEKENTKLNKKNNFIAESMKAASLIQNAILPSTFELSAVVPSYHILYKPKDIVSGDFYWTHPSSSGHYLAVMDCTGHGIPGALMTMMGNTLLNTVVQNEDTLPPFKILQYLHELFVKSLHQKEGGDSNGMDGVLMHISYMQDEVEIQIASAKRPVYYSLPNSEELLQIDAVRKGIGGWGISDFNFQQETLHVPIGTRFIVSTDGLPDQNDVNRKKITSNGFKTCLRSSLSFSPQKQGAYIEQMLTEHMLGTTQRDDILCIVFDV